MTGWTIQAWSRLPLRLARYATSAWIRHRVESVLVLRKIHLGIQVQAHIVVALVILLERLRLVLFLSLFGRVPFQLCAFVDLLALSALHHCRAGVNPHATQVPLQGLLLPLGRTKGALKKTGLFSCCRLGWGG